LAIAVQNDLLNSKSSTVLELKPEFRVTNNSVRYKSVHFRLLFSLYGSLAKSESKVILQNNRFGEVLSTYRVVVDSHDRVIIGIKKARSLLQRLDLVIFDIEHAFRHSLLIHLVLHETTDSLARGFSRVGASGLRVGDKSLVISGDARSFLFEDKFLREESEPVLEVRDNSVSSSPGSVTINVKTQGTSGLRNDSLVLSLVEKGNDKSILSLVVHLSYIRFIQ
jgi:hypothetical protein